MILTAINDRSTRQDLSPEHRADLIYVLDKYCGGDDGKQTDGVRLLGTPIGNAQFVVWILSSIL